MADPKIERHWHAMLALIDLLAAGFIITHVICLIAVKLWNIWLNVWDGTVMKNCNIAFGNTLKSKLLGACNLSSNDVMIETLTLKWIEIIWLSKSSFKLFSWNWIHKNIIERPLAMLGTEVIDIPKETMEYKWDKEDNFEDNLKNHPPKTTGVTWHCDPWNETCPLIEFLNDSK